MKEKVSVTGIAGDNDSDFICEGKRIGERQSMIQDDMAAEIVSKPITIFLMRIKIRR